MSEACVDGAARGHERLAQHLPAKHTLPAVLRTATAKQVDLEVLEVEQIEQVVEGLAHAMRA